MVVRTFGILALGLALALLAGAAQAGSITHMDIDEVGAHLGSGYWTIGTLDIVGPESDVITIGAGYPDAGATYTDVTGYAIGTPLQEARVQFWLSGDSADGRLIHREFAYIDILGDWDPGTLREVDVDLVGIDANALLLSSITETGQVHWGISSVWGEFDVDYVALVARTDGDAHMPEPSAVALFGVGTLLVGAAIRRR